MLVCVCVCVCVSSEPLNNVAYTKLATNIMPFEN